MAQQFYARSSIAKCETLQNLIDKYRISHVIVENDDFVQYLGMAQQFYARSGMAKCETFQNLIDKYRISHVIVENDDFVQDLGVEKIYIDNLYQIYQVIYK